LIEPHHLNLHVSCMVRLVLPLHLTLVLICPVIFAAECGTGADSCVLGKDEQDEISLVQIKRKVQLGAERLGPLAQMQMVSSSDGAQAAADLHGLAEASDWEFDLGQTWVKAAKKNQKKKMKQHLAFKEKFKADAAKEESVARKAYDLAIKSGKNAGRAYYEAKIAADKNALQEFLDSKDEAKNGKQRNKQKALAIKVFGKKAREGIDNWEKKNKKQKEEADDAKEMAEIAASAHPKKMFWDKFQKAMLDPPKKPAKKESTKKESAKEKPNPAPNLAAMLKEFAGAANLTVKEAGNLGVKEPVETAANESTEILDSVLKPSCQEPCGNTQG